ncbi:MAG: 5'-nucleotidase, lipoprotein e(P4) family [Gemmatimonas sp.]
MRRLPLLILALASSACANTKASIAPGTGLTISGTRASTVNGGTSTDSIPLALRWYRASAEVHAIFVQAYRNATDAVQPLAAAQSGKPWGVIMDADETILDNSMYQQGRGGRGYTPETWEVWVRSKKATALPGAADFINRVRALGGKVSIVTNREENVCTETEQNLRAVGLNVDQVLCKPPTSGDKNPRFAAVQGGTAPSKLPAMKVVMWVGDNIQDFPMLSQDVRKGGAAGFAEFGRSWIVLPNPLYGSWDKNPVP